MTTQRMENIAKDMIETFGLEDIDSRAVGIYLDLDFEFLPEEEGSIRVDRGDGVSRYWGVTQDEDLDGCWYCYADIEEDEDGVRHLVDGGGGAFNNVQDLARALKELADFAKA